MDLTPAWPLLYFDSASVEAGACYNFWWVSITNFVAARL